MDKCRDGVLNEPIQLYNICEDLGDPRMKPSMRKACFRGFAAAKQYASTYVDEFLSAGVIEETVAADATVDDVAEAARRAAAAQHAEMQRKEEEVKADAARIAAEAAEAEATKIAQAQQEAARKVREENAAIEAAAAASTAESAEGHEDEARSAMLRAARERVEREFAAASGEDGTNSEDLA